MEIKTVIISLVKDVSTTSSAPTRGCSNRRATVAWSGTQPWRGASGSQQPVLDPQRSELLILYFQSCEAVRVSLYHSLFYYFYDYRYVTHGLLTD